MLDELQNRVCESPVIRRIGNMKPLFDKIDDVLR